MIDPASLSMLLFVLDRANISSKQYQTKPDQTRPYQTRLEECRKYTHLSSVQVGSVEDVRSQDGETQVNYFASFLIIIVYLSQKCLKTEFCALLRGPKTMVAWWHCHPESFCASGKFLRVTLEISLGSFRTL